MEFERGKVNGVRVACSVSDARKLFCTMCSNTKRFLKSLGL